MKNIHPVYNKENNTLNQIVKLKNKMQENHKFIFDILFCFLD